MSKGGQLRLLASYHDANGLNTAADDAQLSGIQPKHAKRLQLQLRRLHAASGPNDMAVPSWRLHRLQGDQKGRWAVWVDEKLTFAFEGKDAVLVDYEDYH